MNNKNIKPTSQDLRNNIRNKSIMSTENYNSLDVIKLFNMVFKDGELPSPVPYEDVKHFNQDTINVFLTLNGLYTFPTLELVEWLKSQIDDDPELVPDAIEICAGTGWIGRSLEIPITDLKLQERSDIKSMYLDNNQPVINYPNDIEKLDAISAIKKYQPEYVIGSYVTSKYGLSGSRYGSIYGVDNSWVANNCHKYFMIGNLITHSKDVVLRRKHLELSFPWLITRHDSNKARIFVFENKQWR